LSVQDSPWPRVHAIGGRATRRTRATRERHWRASDLSVALHSPYRPLVVLSSLQPGGENGHILFHLLRTARFFIELFLLRPVCRSRAPPAPQDSSAAPRPGSSPDSRATSPSPEPTGVGAMPLRPDAVVHVGDGLRPRRRRPDWKPEIPVRRSGSWQTPVMTWRRRCPASRSSAIKFSLCRLPAINHDHLHRSGQATRIDGDSREQTVGVRRNPL